MSARGKLNCFYLVATGQVYCAFAFSLAGCPTRQNALLFPSDRGVQNIWRRQHVREVLCFPRSGLDDSLRSRTRNISGPTYFFAVL